MQKQTIAELRSTKALQTAFEIAAEPPAATTSAVYTLEGEVLSWRAGNRAVRFIVGMGAGRETAEIHYWLTDQRGTRVLEFTDTIRAEFLGNAYAGSVGQLAHPFASKIADRLTAFIERRGRE